MPANTPLWMCLEAFIIAPATDMAPKFHDIKAKRKTTATLRFCTVSSARYHD